MTCPKVPRSGAGGHGAGPGPLLRSQLPSGIRHPEELSLLRAPEKKEKKKKEKEPEEELYDLTKVVLAGGEHRQAGPTGGWAPAPGAPEACLTPTCPPGVAPALFRGMPAHFSDSAQTEACYHMLSRPQPPPDPLVLQRLPRPSSLLDKTQLHSRCTAGRVCAPEPCPLVSGLPPPGPCPPLYPYPKSIPPVSGPFLYACLPPSPLPSPHRAPEPFLSQP